MPQSLTDDNDTFYQRNTTTKSKVLFITNKYTTQSKVPPQKKTNKYHHNNKGFPKNKEQTIECSNLIQTNINGSPYDQITITITFFHYYKNV
jgi:hypothetical protein